VSYGCSPSVIGGFALKPHDDLVAGDSDLAKSDPGQLRSAASSSFLGGTSHPPAPRERPVRVVGGRWRVAARADASLTAARATA